jgi:predicted deacylase
MNAKLRSSLTRWLFCTALFALWTIWRAQASDAPIGWIAAGSPAATPFYVEATSEKGPTVMIVGGIHGDEPAGAYAADQIRHWPLRRGRLLVVPRANVSALAAGTRTSSIPDATNRLNLNRAFPPVASAGTTVPPLAAALWAFVRTNQVDWLLDLHEGADFRIQTNRSVGSSVIPATLPEARRLGELMVRAVNATIANSNRQFVLLNQPIKGSLARAAADELGVRTMIVETTTKSQPLALRARQHRIAVHALLSELGMLDAAVTPERLMAATLARGTTRVAVYDGGGNGGKGVPNVLKQLGAKTHILALRVCPEDICAGVLNQFDAVIFTGGSGSGQAKALGEAGRDEVRRFVEKGGGYIGICAGAYLACSGFSWGLRIIDAKTLSPLWRRGSDMVKLELTDAGRAVLGERPGEFDCLYFQGPIVGPAGDAGIPDYEALAFFRTEVAKNDTPKGIMVNSPAVFSGRFGRGRVLCFSPHPEQTEGLEDFVSRSVAWVVAGSNGTTAGR